MLSVSQTPQDGFGQDQTLHGHAVRLKAKNLTTTRTTTLKVTGMSSGAVFYIDIVVTPKGTGEKAVFGKPTSAPIGLVSKGTSIVGNKGMPKLGGKKTSPASNKGTSKVSGPSMGDSRTLASSK